MSKDNTKRYILTQADLEAYEEWIAKRNKYFRHNGTATWDIWLNANRCPLPNPVEIPSDEEIENKYSKTVTGDRMNPLHFEKKYNDVAINAAKWLRDLIFNKQ